MNVEIVGVYLGGEGGGGKMLCAFYFLSVLMADVQFGKLQYIVIGKTLRS